MGSGTRPWQVGTSAALVLLAALPLGRGGDEYLHVRSTVTKMLEEQTKIIDRCFYEKQMYAPFLPDDTAGNTTAATYDGCQRRCKLEPACFHFTFFSRAQECRLAGRDAIYQRAPEDARGPTIAGPRACPKFPSGCTDMPGSGFPGQTEDESKLAWPSHRVPQNMECWPKNWTSGTYQQCRTFKVLESTFFGWPGKCRGLRLVLLPHLETCESYCRQKLICAAYQEVQVKKPFGPKTCWHADATSGVDCYERGDEPDFAPLSAKRFMRGNVRVLMDLRGLEVQGLYNVFPETYFIHVEDAFKACRYQCYSNLLCQYWQYFMESGCWLEDPLHTGGTGVQYPATTSSWIVGSPRSRTVLAGEYIQHLCFEAGVPGRQVEHQWTTVANSTFCSEDIRKDLGGTGGNLEACKHLTLADAECGNQMYTDGWQCSCIRRPEVCYPKPHGRDNNLYQHKMIAKVNKGKEFLDKRPDLAEALGFHPLDWIKATKERRIFQATVTVTGVQYSKLSASEKVVLKGQYVYSTAAALRISSSALKDLEGQDNSLSFVPSSSPSEMKVSFSFLSGDAQARVPDVRDQLLNETYTKRIVNVTKVFAPAVVKRRVAVSKVSVTRRGGAIPHLDERGFGRRHQHQPKAAASQGHGLARSFTQWAAIFLCGGGLTGLVLHCQQRMSASSFGDGAPGEPGDDSSSSDSDSSEALKGV